MFGGVENCKVAPNGARSKAPVCDHWITEIAGSDPAGGMDVCLLWAVEVSAASLSLVQMSPNECDVSEYDRESRYCGDPGPLGAAAPYIKKLQGL